MTDAREIIAQYLCDRAGQGWSGISTFERAAYRTAAHGIVTDITAAGFRIIGKDEVDQWQPIETAPKDGTEILVCGPHSDGTTYRDVQRWPNGWNGKWPVAYMAYAAGEPTHWMPLPLPPTIGRKA